MQIATYIRPRYFFAIFWCQKVQSHTIRCTKNCRKEPTFSHSSQTDRQLVTTYRQAFLQGNAVCLDKNESKLKDTIRVSEFSGQ